MITVATLNFFDQQTAETIINGSEWCKQYILDPAFDSNYKMIDIRYESPDILFISCFNIVDIKKTLERHNCCPRLTIYYTGEHPANRQPKYPYDYSISFNKDSSTNLYYPIWLCSKDNLRFRENNETLFNKKTNFCSFIVGNGWLQQDLCIQRGQLFDYISNTYARVDSFGPFKNNVGYNLTGDFGEAYKIISKYRFNICFENTSSHGDLSYITEKIINAYSYGCVPIYSGAEDVCEYFNKDSFINCYGKTNNEILEMIREVNEDDEKYKNMLSTPIFNKELHTNRLKTFLNKILKQ